MFFILFLPQVQWRHSVARRALLLQGQDHLRGLWPPDEQDQEGDRGGRHPARLGEGKAEAPVEAPASMRQFGWPDPQIKSCDLGNRSARIFDYLFYYLFKAAICMLSDK